MLIFKETLYMSTAKAIKGYIYVIASAIIYGFMPLLAKLIYQNGVNPMTLVLLRNLLSIPVIALMAGVKKESLVIKMSHVPPLAVTTLFGACLTSVLLFTAYQYIDTGTATVFHFIYPAFVVLLEAFVLKKGVTKGNLAGLLLCVIGICMFYTPGKELNVTGSVIALLSGVTYAVYVMFITVLKGKGLSQSAVNFYLSLFSSVILFVICCTGGFLSLPINFKGWIYTFAFAAIINAGAVSLFQHGTFIIGGQRSSILSTFEPAVSVLVGWAILKESLTVASIVGVVFVIASVFVILNNKNKEM